LLYGSEGLLGIVLEVTLRIFPQRLVNLQFRIMRTADVVKQIQEIIKGDQTAFLLIQPERTIVELRAPAKPNARESTSLVIELSGLLLLGVQLD
jgi:FAD/FMN-containing dehydrogenase